MKRTLAITAMLAVCFNVPVRAQEKKSPLTAALLSFLVPGLGEHYAHRYDQGKYFSFSEAALWGTFTGLSLYAHEYRKDMEETAIHDAGASARHKGDENYF